MEKLGLYIHIPFCRRKCHYCDFISYPDIEDRFEPYIHAVIAEARLYRPYLAHAKVDTVFIGGGTPSLLPAALLNKLVSGLKDVFDFAPAEATIEANPETLNAEKLSMYVECGLNRLSIGLQSHDNTILSHIGRRHTYADFLTAYRTAEDFFSNINIDVMFALPGQSEDSFADTIYEIIRLKPAHVSAYALKLEPGTRLADEFTGTDEDIDRSMYHTAICLLENAGYRHYETSNFSQPGKDCLHNLKYWTGGYYLGLGVAAHSYIEDGCKTRFSNTENINEYIRCISAGGKPVVQKNILSAQDEEAEYIMLRLRLNQGIEYQHYCFNFKKDFLTKYKTAVDNAVCGGLITADLNGIRPTLKGFDLQNTLINVFMKKI